jgi:hypothetical protein
MKLLLSLIVLTLSACATVASRPKLAGTSDSPPTPGTLTISGDELRQTGRIELPDALRASSPIFH